MTAITSDARTRPDFSGVWQVNLEKSAFRGPAPRSIVITIDHRESAVTQIVLIVAADGREQQLTYVFETSGRETTNQTAQGSLQCRAHWNEDEMVVESVLTTPGRCFHFSDHWSLSGDGRTLQMAHLDDDLAGQVVILEKAGVPQR